MYNCQYLSFRVSPVTYNKKRGTDAFVAIILQMRHQYGMSPSWIIHKTRYIYPIYTFSTCGINVYILLAV